MTFWKKLHSNPQAVEFENGNIPAADYYVNLDQVTYVKATLGDKASIHFVGGDMIFVDQSAEEILNRDAIKLVRKG